MILEVRSPKREVCNISSIYLCSYEKEAPGTKSATASTYRSITLYSRWLLLRGIYGLERSNRELVTLGVMGPNLATLEGVPGLHQHFGMRWYGWVRRC